VLIQQSKIKKTTTEMTNISWKFSCKFYFWKTVIKSCLVTNTATLYM